MVSKKLIIFYYFILSTCLILAYYCISWKYNIQKLSVNPYIKNVSSTEEECTNNSNNKNASIFNIWKRNWIIYNNQSYIGIYKTVKTFFETVDTFLGNLLDDLFCAILYIITLIDISICRLFKRRNECTCVGCNERAHFKDYFDKLFDKLSEPIIKSGVQCNYCWSKNEEDNCCFSDEEQCNNFFQSNNHNDGSMFGAILPNLYVSDEFELDPLEILHHDTFVSDTPDLLEFDGTGNLKRKDGIRTMRTVKI